MVAFLFDYDGVLLRTERAKALGWLTAALHLRGDLPRTCLDDLRTGDSPTIERLARAVSEQWAGPLAQITAMAGESRDATCRKVAELFDLDHGHAALVQLDQTRTSVKNRMLLALSSPIAGTVRFVRAAAHGGISCGLVTQTTRTAVAEQAPHFQLPLDLFGAIECCGDLFYTDIPAATNRKAVAYAVACAALRIRPSEAVAIEDSRAGLDAAAAAGVIAIALEEPGNGQDLSATPPAPAMIVNDLTPFADSDLIEQVSRASRAEAIAILRHRSQL